MMTEEQAKVEICRWIDAGICFDAQDMDQWLYDLTHNDPTGVSPLLPLTVRSTSLGARK